MPVQWAVQCNTTVITRSFGKEIEEKGFIGESDRELFPGRTE
jgi:hypothetical protein